MKEQEFRHQHGFLKQVNIAVYLHLQNTLQKWVHHFVIWSKKACGIILSSLHKTLIELNPEKVCVIQNRSFLLRCSRLSTAMCCESQGVAEEWAVNHVSLLSTTTDNKLKMQQCNSSKTEMLFIWFSLINMFIERLLSRLNSPRHSASVLVWVHVSSLREELST